MHLPFHPDALIELNQAVAWHERERAGYGSFLFDEVVRKVEQAARIPRPTPSPRASSRPPAEQLRPPAGPKLR
jgi:hypothetical protein